MLKQKWVSDFILNIVYCYRRISNEALMQKMNELSMKLDIESHRRDLINSKNKQNNENI